MKKNEWTEFTQQIPHVSHLLLVIENKQKLCTHKHIQIHSHTVQAHAQAQKKTPYGVQLKHEFKWTDDFFVLCIRIIWLLVIIADPEREEEILSAPEWDREEERGRGNQYQTHSWLNLFINTIQTRTSVRARPSKWKKDEQDLLYPSIHFHVGTQAREHQINCCLWSL